MSSLANLTVFTLKKGYARNVCDVSQFHTFAFYAINNFYFLINELTSRKSGKKSVTTLKVNRVPFLVLRLQCTSLQRVDAIVNLSGFMAMVFLWRDTRGTQLNNNSCNVQEVRYLNFEVIRIRISDIQ